MNEKIHLTPQRKAIYEAIRESDNHPTAADIITRLREQGHNFAYGTIYNSLRFLTENGLIRELKVGDAASHFDANMARHIHIMCQHCGEIEEVYVPLPRDWLAQVAEETHYTISSPVGMGQVVLKGVCPRCNKPG